MRLHAQHNQFKRFSWIEIIIICLVSIRGLGWIQGLAWRLQSKPLSVSIEVGLPVALVETDVVESYAMPTSISLTASSGQPAPRIAIILDFLDLNRLAYDEAIKRQGERVFKRLTKRPELFALAVCIGKDFLNQYINGSRVCHQIKSANDSGTDGE